jgi:hypothetical protein
VFSVDILLNGTACVENSLQSKPPFQEVFESPAKYSIAFLTTREKVNFIWNGMDSNTIDFRVTS